MAGVVQAVEEVRALIGQPPVVVGGLAVMCRLSRPYRATTDLDVVDRLLGATPQLQVLRSAQGAEPVEPTSVLLPTVYGKVKVDVLEVRQIEILITVKRRPRRPPARLRPRLGHRQCHRGHHRGHAVHMVRHR
jgi:hypothetical protein